MKKYKKIIILVIMALLIIGYYYYLTTRHTGKEEKQPQQTEIEKVLETDSMSVMKTPRETVKAYSNIIKCFYNESPTDEQIEKLGNKARELFDDELLLNNQEENYLKDLNADIFMYEKAKKIVIGYTIEESSEIKKYTDKDKEYAIVNASYTLRETEKFEKVNEEYILRKDEQGCWKILGWRLADKAVTEEKNE